MGIVHYPVEDLIEISSSHDGGKFCIVSRFRDS